MFFIAAFLLIDVKDWSNYISPKHGSRHGFKYCLILIYIGNIISGFEEPDMLLTL